MERIDTAPRPLDALCHDIVDRYHAPLRRRLLHSRETLLPLIGGGPGHQFELVRGMLADLIDRIQSHLSKEEYLLFPAIAALVVADGERRARPRTPFVTILHPIRMLEAEHASIEADMARLRRVALEVTVPAPQAPAWQQWTADLIDIESGLLEHHRTENEVLFPGALDAERRLLWLGYDGTRDRSR